MTINQSLRAKSEPLDRINAQIFSIIESEGCLPWHSKHWLANSLPRRFDNTPFSGANTILLTIASLANPAFRESRWFTFKQAKALGGHVRAGQKSLAYARLLKQSVSTDDDGEEMTKSYARYYPVFNISQIDGLPDSYYNAPKERQNVRLECLESWVNSLGVKVNHVAGSVPCYSPVRDEITMPKLKHFESSLDYYATLAHEVGHWAFHHDRVVCNFGRGELAYPREEIAVELLSANVMAHFGFEPNIRDDHAPYIKGWLEQLRDDQRFFIEAVGHASKAFDYLIDPY